MSKSMKSNNPPTHAVMSGTLGIIQTLPAEQARRFLMIAREDTQDGYWLSLRADLYQALAQQSGASIASEKLRPLDDALHQMKAQPETATKLPRRWWSFKNDAGKTTTKTPYPVRTFLRIL
jgi:hypothetical protein